MDNSILQSYNGLIRFYDGTVIAIEDQEYSPDGMYNWEKIFNPNPHLSTLDGVTLIEGHRYKRVKHTGDTNFQMPYRIIPEEPVFRVQDDVLQYKLETQSDAQWKDLMDLATLHGQDGAKGEQGIPGEGFNIDLYGYYKLRPDCATAITNNCNTCNPGASSQNSSVTFLSLGDGVLVLTSALIAAGNVVIDAVTFSHFSNDLVNWTAISAGIVDLEARYLATNGTGAVYIDMRDKDYYGTRGSVYICSEGRWVLLNNIATPSYMVGESLGSTNIGYLDHFVDLGDFDVIDQSITIGGGLLKLIQGSVDNTAFSNNAFGYGLNYVLGTSVEVDPADFDGFGLISYTSLGDSKTKLQVIIDSLLGDGLLVEPAVTVDGETRHLAGVDVTELINNNSGLIAVNQPDGFNDLVVNLGHGIILDGGVPNALTLDVDNLSLVVDANSLRVKPYAAGNDGILPIHLNPAVVRANYGLIFDAALGLYPSLDGTSIGLNAGQLRIVPQGVTGDKLNPNVADNTAGLTLLNSKLSVLVDDVTIGFNGQGELEFKGLGGTAVTSVTVGATTVVGDLTLLTTSADGSINLSAVGAINVGNDTITLNATVNSAWLTGQLDAYMIDNPITAAAWGGITGTLSAQTDLNNALSAKVTSATLYGNPNGVMIHATHGLVLKAAGASAYFKLIVDAEGNLDTLPVTL